MKLSKILKTVINLIDNVDVEPYVIEKVNRQTGEKEKICIIPDCYCRSTLTPYPSFIQ